MMKVINVLVLGSDACSGKPTLTIYERHRQCVHSTAQARFIEHSGTCRLAFRHAHNQKFKNNDVGDQRTGISSGAGSGKPTLTTY